MAKGARPVLEVATLPEGTIIKIRGSRGGIRHTYAVTTLPPGHSKEDFNAAVASCLSDAQIRPNVVEGV